jgi:hypothetical protein
MPSISQELESTRTARWYQAARNAQRLAASESPSIKPALEAEAKVTAFWPYRESVIKIGDAFEMAPFEWTAAYLRALAAWAGDNRPLAARHPADPPECVAEDMEVLAAICGYRADESTVTCRAARLVELAGTVIGLVLDDASIAPVEAFNSVRHEVHQLLTGPSAASLGQILELLNSLGSLLVDLGMSCPDSSMGYALRC